MHFQIHEECIGCGACVRVCPAGAVSGEKKAKHIIDTDLCIECGACGRVCPSLAISDSRGERIPKQDRKTWRRPVITLEKCMACEACVEVCPGGSLSMAHEKQPLQRNHARLSAPETCVSCGWCLENCQFGAIVMEAGA